MRSHLTTISLEPGMPRTLFVQISRKCLISGSWGSALIIKYIQNACTLLEYKIKNILAVWKRYVGTTVYPPLGILLAPPSSEQTD
jgi:hypothetical protein